MKKILLSLAMLLAGVGAWAQTYDGIYTIGVDETQKRGFIGAGQDYDAYPVLCDISWSDYTSNSATPIENGKNWYITSINEGRTYYVYNVALGKFLVGTTANDTDVNFGDEPYQWKIYELNGNLKFEDPARTGKIYLTGGCGRGPAARPVQYDSNASDGGTHMTLTAISGGETTFASQIAAADQILANQASVLLQALVDEANEIESGTGIGDYTAESVAELKTAISDAEAKIASDNVSQADIDALQAAIDALAMVLPDPAKFYVLRCNHENRYVYVNDANKMHFTGTKPEKFPSNFVWQFEAGSDANTCKMKSVHTQSFLNTVSANVQATFGEGVDVTILKASVEGAFVFEAGNKGIGLHAHGDPNNTKTVVGYTNTAGANPYFFEEVTEFSYTATVGESDWSSLMLGYNATIPAGVKCYIVDATTETVASLTEVTEILPANTPVLVNATADEYAFAFTAESASEISGNKLEGSLADKYVAPAEGGACYVLSQPEDAEVGLYKTTLNKNASGAEGTSHFLNNANKAYLPITAVAGARLLFDFGTETAIESIQGAESADAVVYDLAGRRVQGAHKGLYIVNGKKVIK